MISGEKTSVSRRYRKGRTSVGEQRWCAGRVSYLRFAVTVVSATIWIMQVSARPEHPPPVQPFQVEPAAGTAVTMTAAPG